MSIAAQGGGAAAYQQLQRLPNDLGQAMKDLTADQRAEQRASEGRIAAKQKRDDEYKAGLEIDPEEFAVTATGWQDHDEIMFAASKDAMNQSIALNTEASKLWDAGKETESRAMREQAMRIQNSFKNFSSQREEFATMVAESRKKIQEGKVLTKSHGQFIDALDRHEYTATYKDGDFIITALVRDANGDQVLDAEGKPTYIQKSMNDVRKGFDRPFEIEEAYGKNGMLDTMMINFGVKKFDETRGDYIVTTEQWDNTHQLSLNNYIEGVVGDSKNPANNREMYKWYVNATGEEKFGDWTDEDKAIVTNYIKEGVASQFPESEKLKIRGLTATEKKRESAADRSLRRSEGQANRDARAAEGAANRAAAREKWEAQLAAKIEADKNKNKMKGLGKNAEEKVKAVGLYRLAKQIATLDKNADEAKVQQIIDDSGYGFLLGGDLDAWFGFGATEYDIGKTGGIKIKDVFKNFKAMVKETGLEIEDTDLKDIMANPEKYELDDAETETTSETDPLGIL